MLERRVYRSKCFALGRGGRCYGMNGGALDRANTRDVGLRRRRVDGGKFVEEEVVLMPSPRSMAYSIFRPGNHNKDDDNNQYSRQEHIISLNLTGFIV